MPLDPIRSACRFFVGATLVLLSGTAVAFAEPPQGAERDASATGAVAGDLDARARDLLHRGEQLAREGRWAEAHGAWVEAWGLKQSFDLAANLGFAEQEMGLHRDAAEHFAWSLRYFPFSESRAHRRWVEDALAEARTHVGAFALEVGETGAAGAEVWIDGKSVGWAPFDDEVFVEPGAHVVEAGAPGFVPARLSVEAQAGRSSTVAIALDRVPPPPAAVPAVPAKDPWIVRAIAIGVFVAALVLVALKYAFDRRAEQRIVVRSRLGGGARRRGRHRRWLLAQTRLAAHATALRVKRRGAHVLLPAVDGELAPEDTVVVQRTVNALYSAGHRIEARGAVLAQLATQLPVSAGERVRRSRMARRMRRDVETARASLEVLGRIERHAGRGGSDAVTLAKAVTGYIDTWIWRISAMEKFLAREEAVLALDAAARSLRPTEVALISEGIGAAHASLGWARRQMTTAWRFAPERRAACLQDIRRELAAAWWARDLVVEAHAQLQERLSPSPSPSAEEAGFVVRLGRWCSSEAARTKFLRRADRARVAERAVYAIGEALREEAAHLSAGIAHAQGGASIDPRLPPSPGAPPPGTATDVGAN